MQTIRPILGIALQLAGLLVGLHLVFDVYYADIRHQLWDIADGVIAVCLVVALFASARRVFLAGLKDQPAKFELLFTMFVSLLFFHTLTDYITGQEVTANLWMFVDALFVIVAFNVGWRLRPWGKSAQEE
ncbi:MAG: hypothetical protein OXC80_07310 [Gammaproteobacteria bacterium]|nr:hypothetical protein [Gammaproteobacteria bacterium]